MILRPTSISPNNDTLDSSKQITISWKNLGDRQISHQIIIYDNETSEVVYNTGKVNSYNSFHVIPANTLSNGNTYKFTITVWNQNNQSATSDWAIFYCYSTPTCSFINIVDDGEVLNNSYLFRGEYYQNEGVPIKSFLMILYNSHKEILMITPEIFSDVIEYEFFGFNTEDDYYIELQVRSQNDLINSTGMIHFTVRYEVPANYISLMAENVPAHAAIRLSWNTTQIIGRVIEGRINYIDGDIIDLTEGAIIFKEGMKNFYSFALKTWVQLVNLRNEVTTHIVPTCIGDVVHQTRDGTTELFRLHSNVGDIWVEFIFENDFEGRFWLKKNIFNTQYSIFSNKFNPYIQDKYYVGVLYDGSVCDLYVEPENS